MKPCGCRKQARQTHSIWEIRDARRCRGDPRLSRILNEGTRSSSSCERSGEGSLGALKDLTPRVGLALDARGQLAFRTMSWRSSLVQRQLREELTAFRRPPELAADWAAIRLTTSTNSVDEPSAFCFWASIAALTCRASGRAMRSTLRRRPSLTSMVRVQLTRPRMETFAICFSPRELAFSLSHPVLISTRSGYTLMVLFVPVPCAKSLCSILAL